jgi:hypothetical protein
MALAEVLEIAAMAGGIVMTSPDQVEDDGASPLQVAMCGERERE